MAISTEMISAINCVAESGVVEVRRVHAVYFYGEPSNSRLGLALSKKAKQLRGSAGGSAYNWACKKMKAHRPPNGMVRYGFRDVGIPCRFTGENAAFESTATLRCSLCIDNAAPSCNCARTDRATKYIVSSKYEKSPIRVFLDFQLSGCVVHSTLCRSPQMHPGRHEAPTLKDAC